MRDQTERKERQDINFAAMEHMHQLNERLHEAGYTEQERELILVRLLLCFFADDTEVFPDHALYRYLDRCTEQGITGMEMLNRLFLALAGEEDVPADLKEFPAVSKAVFGERVPSRETDAFFWMILSGSRDISWGQLSPAIFGAMFQEVVDQKDRKEWGAYYTSEENILRLVGPLFLDDLRFRREACRGNKKKLKEFHARLSRLTFLDPACGCANFLILIYRELRRLELDVVSELYDTSQRVLDTSIYCHVSLSQFYGLELEPFQAQIARIGLWLTERQMDREAAEIFGVSGCLRPWIRPVKIRQCNALTTDWSEVIPPEKLDYIVGNPPFMGARLMTASQKQDMKAVFRGSRASGNLDYVAGWYRKAAEYMMGTHVRAAFVSTNSICQGEQAAILWKQMCDSFNMNIDFARKTFVWNNEAKNQAKVHCVIVGFSDASAFSNGEQLNAKSLWSGDRRQLVPHINAYLTAAPDVYVTGRRKPVSPIPEMSFGSMANDGGFLVLSPEERKAMVEQFPEARKFIRPYLGSDEFINGRERYCLWLDPKDEDEYMSVPEIANRVAGVIAYRRKSSREATRAMAESPAQFGEIRQPESGTYILVPRVSSMRRSYIPMGFVTAHHIASDAVLIIPGADEADFAVLTSKMHMIWVNTIAGRLKSDFRYSASVVYNNFPFPGITEEQRKQLEEKGRRILEIRSDFADSSLAELYDPEQMPGALKAAHQELDALVDDLYGCAGKDEDEKLEELFRRYTTLTAGVKSGRMCI